MDKKARLVRIVKQTNALLVIMVSSFIGFIILASMGNTYVTQYSALMAVAIFSSILLSISVTRSKCGECKTVQFLKLKDVEQNQCPTCHKPLYSEKIQSDTAQHPNLPVSGISNASQGVTASSIDLSDTDHKAHNPFGLFDKKHVWKFVRDEDCVAFSAESKYRSVAQSLKNDSDRQQLNIVAAHFRRTFEDFKAILDSYGIKYVVLRSINEITSLNLRAWSSDGVKALCLLSDIIPDIALSIDLPKEGRDSYSQVCIKALEHYPLAARDSKIFLLADAFTIQTRLCFYSSLEEPLMRMFGSQKIAAIMKWTGVNENEVIEHGSITKAIESAQAKVTSSVVNEHPADSQAEWFARNYPDMSDTGKANKEEMPGTFESFKKSTEVKILGSVLAVLSIISINLITKGKQYETQLLLVILPLFILLWRLLYVIKKIRFGERKD